MGYPYDTDELFHHGVKGQKWGVRRYQNRDGTRTSAGKKRYSEDMSDAERSAKRKQTAKRIGGIAAGLAVTAGIAAAGVYYSKNKDSVDAIVKRLGSSAMSGISAQAAKGKQHLAYSTAKAINFAQTQGDTLKRRAVSTRTMVGMQARQVVRETRDGAMAGLVAAPGKVAKVAVEGAATVAAMAMLKKIIGEEKRDRYIDAYNAFNKKNKVNKNPFKGKKTRDDDDD